MSLYLASTKRARLLSGAMSAAGGTALIVVGLVAMQSRVENDGAGKEQAVTHFELPTPKKPPPEKKPQAERPRRSNKAKPRATTSAPKVATALSGVSFGLEAYRPDVGERLDESLLGSAEDVVMTEGTVDVPPRVSRRPPLTLPERLRRRGTAGRVSLSLLIDKTGNVETVEILEATPPGVFDELAADFVRRWSFEPATYRGAPVKTWARQTITFEPQ